MDLDHVAGTFCECTSSVYAPGSRKRQEDTAPLQQKKVLKFENGFKNAQVGPKVLKIENGFKKKIMELQKC